MNKSIKVSDKTYNRLEWMLQPRESFNDAVVRCLDVYDTIRTVSDTLGPSSHIKEFKHGPERIRDEMVKGG